MQAKRSKSAALLALIGGAEVTRYLERQDIERAPEPSNYPAMIGGLTTTVESSATCEACEGTGMRLLSKKRLGEYKRRIQAAEFPGQIRAHMDEEAHCARCDGSGVTFSTTRVLDSDSFFTTMACPTCTGVGVNRHGDPCLFPGCLGGYVIPCTVKPKGSTKKGRLPTGWRETDGTEYLTSAIALGDPAAAPIADDVAELMRTSDALGRVRRASATAADALTAYHGTEGNRWAKTKWGRGFAIWPLTKSGARLASEQAKTSRGRSGFMLTPMERIATVRQRESCTDTPNIRWRALMREADAEARELQAEALRLLTRQGA